MVIHLNEKGEQVAAESSIAKKMRDEPKHRHREPSGFIAREAGANIGHESLSAMSRSGHFYRGMSEAEYLAGIAQGKGIKSNLSSSIASVEGTNFSHDLADAESYANYGRSDPRITGVSNYLAEVSGGKDITLKRDGYYHSRSTIPNDRITRLWRMNPVNNAIHAIPVAVPENAE